MMHIAARLLLKEHQEQTNDALQKLDVRAIMICGRTGRLRSTDASGTSILP